MMKNNSISKTMLKNHMDWIEELSREDLIKLVRVYARNWLAHDGCWFLAAEEQYGLETAMQLDAKSWERFAVAEARRIMKEFEIPANGGLAALKRALQLRLYAAINRQEIEIPNNNTMIFRMLECRVQQARREKGLPAFPCKPVGIVEFSNFARTVDERIHTRWINCPPDPGSSSSCSWEFSIDSRAEI
jgi:hypothetical protein